MNKAQRIKHARTHPKSRDRKFTQEEIASACEVTRAAVNQWESEDPERNTSPKDHNLEAIAEITGYDYNWLRTGVDASGEVKDVQGAYLVLPTHYRRLLENFDQLNTREQRAVLDLVNGLVEAKLVEAPPVKQQAKGKHSA